MAARRPYTTQNMVQPVHYSLSTYTAKQMKTMYYSLSIYSVVRVVKWGSIHDIAAPWITFFTVKKRWKQIKIMIMIINHHKVLCVIENIHCSSCNTSMMTFICCHYIGRFEHGSLIRFQHIIDYFHIIVFSSAWGNPLKLGINRSPSIYSKIKSKHYIKFKL